MFDFPGFHVGIDLEVVRRFNSTADGIALRNRVLSAAELAIAVQLSEARLAEFVAGRFAAKEAVVKALRLTLGDGSILRDIEVLRRDDGSPVLALHARANEAANLAGLGQGQVSISHSGGFACAIAIFLAKTENIPK